jgi:hypothetical protein
MASRSTRSASLTLGAAFLLSMAGCGGKGQETDTATVIPDPTAARSSAPATAAPAATTTTAAPSTATPAPAAAVKAEGWGTLKGRVVFDGDAPARAVLSTDPEKAKACMAGEIKSERLVVDAGSKGVKNVIVYIPKPTAVNPEAKSAKAASTVVFDQKKCVFEPHVLAVMTNTKIDIKSSDPVSHNINCKVQNNTFNESVAPNGEVIKTPAAAARQPGPVVCDIHPWMTAYWLVLDNPYFAVTDDKGNFEIKNAPAGTQKVAVWQEATGFVTLSSGQEVTLAANGDTTQEFQIKPAQVKPEQ